MKNSFYKVCILFFACLFSLNVFSQNYTVGQSVDDSVGVFEYYGYGCFSYYPYPSNYSASVQFDAHTATGLSKVLIITAFTGQSGVSFVESENGSSFIQLGDTLTFESENSYYNFFLEDNSFIQGVFRIIGTPTQAGEEYATIPFSWFIGMSECFAPHYFYLEGTATVQDTFEVLTPITVDTSVCEVLYYEGVEYLESGTYSQTIINEDNEEQEVQLSLEIQHLNYTLTESQGVIKANQTNAYYQWYRADGPNIYELEGETNRYLTPIESGIYFVRLTTEVCDGFSQEYNFEYQNESHSGLTEIKGGNHEFQVYPNPFTETILIDSKDSFEKTISIYSIQGKLVYQTVLSPGINRINLKEFPAGSYQVQIESSKDFSVQTIVKL
jgi:hypothetical protein